MCAGSHTSGTAVSSLTGHLSTDAWSTAMMTLTDRQAQTRTEAEEFFRECYSLPVAVVGIASLFLTDIAVVVATIAAMG